MFSQETYQTLPPILQMVALNLFAAKLHLQRFGKSFKEARAFLDRSQWFTEEEMEQYQNTRLQELIRHAYESVPFYRKAMEKRSLKPKDILNSEDLTKLPILTKEDVRSNWEDMISARYKRSDLILGHTSGTTGSPLEFFWDRQMCVFNNAVDWRQKAWAGLELGQPHAVLLGRVVVPTQWRKPPFWRMNYIHNQLWMSVFHMSPENLKLYVRKLRQFKPKAIEGYPSSIYILAKCMETNGERLPIAAVLTSSETLFPYQKKVIEKVFCCKVYDFYGMAERVIFASECGHGHGKHINSEYGITELVGGDGEPVSMGQVGRIVGTSLHNFGMPFMRYKTSDVSALLEEKCACGRKLPLMKDITTKAEDIIVTKDGRMITPSALTHPFKPLHGIMESQIIQDEIDRIQVNLVATKDFDVSQIERLKDALRERLGPQMRIDVEFAESIPLTAAGKFRWVISRVPPPF